MARNIFKKETKKIGGFIFSQALAFGILGLIIFISIYYTILSLRVQLGYFDYPILTTISEVTWYFIGTSFLLTGVGIGSFIGFKKGKRK